MLIYFGFVIIVVMRIQRLYPRLLSVKVIQTPFGTVEQDHFRMCIEVNDKIVTQEVIKPIPYATKGVIERLSKYDREFDGIERVIHFKAYYWASSFRVFVIKHLPEILEQYKKAFA